MENNWNNENAPLKRSNNEYNESLNSTSDNDSYEDYQDDSNSNDDSEYKEKSKKILIGLLLLIVLIGVGIKVYTTYQNNQAEQQKKIEVQNKINEVNYEEKQKQIKENNEIEKINNRVKLVNEFSKKVDDGNDDVFNDKNLMAKIEEKRAEKRRRAEEKRRKEEEEKRREEEKKKEEEERKRKEEEDRLKEEQKKKEDNVEKLDLNWRSDKILQIVANENDAPYLARGDKHLNVLKSNDKLNANNIAFARQDGNAIRFGYYNKDSGSMNYYRIFEFNSSNDASNYAKQNKDNSYIDGTTVVTDQGLYQKLNQEGFNFKKVEDKKEDKKSEDKNKKDQKEDKK